MMGISLIDYSISYIQYAIPLLLLSSDPSIFLDTQSFGSCNPDPDHIKLCTLFYWTSPWPHSFRYVVRWRQIDLQLDICCGRVHGLHHDPHCIPLLCLHDE